MDLGLLHSIPSSDTYTYYQPVLMTVHPVGEYPFGNGGFDTVMPASAAESDEIVLREWDVIIRHASAQTELHEGNRFFRQLVERNRLCYMSLPNNAPARSMIIDDIMEEISVRDGRFLQPPRGDNNIGPTRCNCCYQTVDNSRRAGSPYWTVAPRANVREKIRKALSRPLSPS